MQFKVIFLWSVFYVIVKGNSSMLRLEIKLLKDYFKISS
jgi:hypothetical protein